jgi:hypothetical protein
MVIELPLVFFNSGPIPVIVQNLRLNFRNEEHASPLTFMATVEKLGTDQGRALASQFPIRGREAKLLICEFQRFPGGMNLEPPGYPMELQALLNESKKWRKICDFSLSVSQKAAETINRQFIAHDNMADE